MNQKIYPCLWFDGQASEAANFYCAAFGQSKMLSESPMVVMFELEGTKVMALNGGPQFNITPAISLFVRCKTFEETNALWDKLFEGGKAMIPIGEYPWSKRYGWLQDKFGMTWQISIDDGTSSVAVVTPSFLFTNTMFGKAEAAIQRYSSIFPNAQTHTLSHYPDGDANAGKVLYAEFRLNNYPFIAMDGPGEHAYTFTEGVSMVVNCKDQAEIDHYWNALSEGGSEGMCGWLKDKYGVSWQIVPEILGTLMNDPLKGQAVVQAFLKMKKFDIATLLAC